MQLLKPCVFTKCKQTKSPYLYDKLVQVFATADNHNCYHHMSKNTNNSGRPACSTSHETGHFENPP